jgi:hypothetical protein
LRDGLSRHLTEQVQFRVFTEQSIPKGLDGWWGKLALFRKGTFAPDERVVYVDLDTVMVGNVDFLARYAGPFAMLRDFYHPLHLASGVMAWRGDECAEIWSNWLALGCPRAPRGDQQVIEMLFPQAAVLQDAFPEKIISWKAHCRNGRPSENASVVCFHGEPRPHETEIWNVA